MALYYCRKCQGQEEFPFAPFKCSHCGERGQMALLDPDPPKLKTTKGKSPENMELPKPGKKPAASKDALPAPSLEWKTDESDKDKAAADTAQISETSLDLNKQRSRDASELPLPSPKGQSTPPPTPELPKPPTPPEPARAKKAPDAPKKPKQKSAPRDRAEIEIPATDSSAEVFLSETPPGTVLWRFQASNQSGRTSAQIHCPAVDDAGRIYACLGDRLYAFEVEGGQGLKTLWSRQTGGVISSPPAIGPDGCVRVHAGDGVLHAFDPEGLPAWEAVSVGEPLASACPLVDADGNTWISLQAGGMTKVDAKGQTSQRPFFRSLAKLDSCGLLRDETIYIGAEDQFVYAIDLSGPRGANGWNQNENRGRTGRFINSAPALLGDAGILVSSSDQHLYAFDWDGKEQWKTRLPGHALTSPVVSENRCFVGVSAGQPPDSETGQLCCLDGQNGRVIWEYAAPRPVVTVPVVGADRVVYFGNDQGTIYAVNTKGTSEWKTALDAPLPSAGTLARPGLLVYVLADGSLAGLACSSERLAEGWPKYRGTLAQSGLTS